MTNDRGSSDSDQCEPVLDDEAEELFANWLESRDSGNPVELESLAAGRTDLLEALRGLHSFWDQLERAGAVDAALAGALADIVGGDLRGDAVPRTERYHVRREVGRGGMGAVFEVDDEHLHRRIAMKVVRTQRGAAGDRALTRFLDEAQVTAQLEHPGIVPIHELGRDDEGRAYFTMALVEGETFARVIARLHEGDEDWSLPRALDVIAKVGDAVGYAHSRGVVHRDLKPDNIMVGAFGRVYVMDWGLAQVASKRGTARSSTADGPDVASLDAQSSEQTEAELFTDQPFLTHDGDVVGTPAYMSPEQAFGVVSEQGPRCDVYALGAMLYHALSGRAPFADREEGTLAALRHGAPTALLAIDPKLPRELVAVCELAMRRDRARRYPDVDAFTADLRAYLEGRVVGAYESGGLALARKWVLRHRALTLLLVGLAIALTYAFASQQSHVRVTRLAQRFMKLERLDDIEAEAQGLWPALPERASDLESFVARGEELADLLPGYRAELAAVERGGAAVRAATDSADDWIFAKQIEIERRLSRFAESDSGALQRVRARLERARSIGALRRRFALEPGDLLALGPDPHSGLASYEHLQTASLERLAALIATGTLDAPASERGAVLHLVPGPQPYLVGRTELTRDHWSRLSEDEVSGEQPMTGISWSRALECIARGGLVLPTQEQWCRAALGGVDGPLWFVASDTGTAGDDPGAYFEAEVFSQQHSVLTRPEPVASRLPNPFGLYDVHGNVSEFQLDPFYAANSDIPEGEWLELRGVTRKASYSFFGMRPELERDRELMNAWISGEVSEDQSDPYRGVRVVAPWQGR